MINENDPQLKEIEAAFGRISLVENLKRQKTRKVSGKGRGSCDALAQRISSVEGMEALADRISRGGKVKILPSKGFSRSKTVYGYTTKKK